MELKLIASDKFTVAAISKRGHCDIEDALYDLEDQSTLAWRVRLAQMLASISEHGLCSDTHIWIKPLDPKNGVYELKAGKMRLFCVKGADDMILICTCLLRKQNQKADKQEILNAARIKKEFDAANKVGSVVMIGLENAE